MPSFSASIPTENYNPLTAYYDAQTASTNNAQTATATDTAQQNLADRATLRGLAPGLASNDPATIAAAQASALTLPTIGGTQTAAGTDAMHTDQRAQLDHQISVGGGLAQVILDMPPDQQEDIYNKTFVPTMKRLGGNPPEKYPGATAMTAFRNAAFSPQQRMEYYAKMPIMGPGGTPVNPFAPPAQTPSGSSASGSGAFPTGGGTPFVAKNLPPGVSPEIDQVVRTVIGEAGNQSDVGQQAVAHVIRNRMTATGASGQDVIFAPNQFEPWNPGATRAKLEAIDPSSPQYQRALANVYKVANGTAADPTGGATHFYSPGVMNQRGQPAGPSWAQGQTPVVIGGHNFYKLGGGPASAAPAAAPPAQTTAAPVGGPVPPPGTPVATAAPSGSATAPALPPEAASHPGLPAAQALARTVLAAPPEQHAAVYAANVAQAKASGATDAPPTYPGDAAMSALVGGGAPAPGASAPLNQAAGPAAPSAPTSPQNSLMPPAGAPLPSQTPNTLAPPQTTPTNGQNLLRLPFSTVPVTMPGHDNIGIGPNGPEFIKGIPLKQTPLENRSQGGPDVVDELGNVTARHRSLDIETLQDPKSDITSSDYLQAFGRTGQGTATGPDGRIVLPDMRIYRQPPGAALDSSGHLIPSIGQAPPGTPNVSYTNRDRLNDQIKEDRGQLPKLAADVQQQDQSLQLTLAAANAAKGLPTGANAEGRLNVANWLKTYAPDIAIKLGVGEDGKLLADPGKMAEARKLLAAAALQKEQAYGGSGGLGISENFQKNNANIDTPENAIRDMSILNAVTTIARKDYLLGKMAHVSSNISGQIDPNSSAKYSIPENFDKEWSTQNNTHVYLGAIAAAQGKPFDEWSKGLSEDDMMRAIGVVARIAPGSTVQGRKTPISVSRPEFAPKDPSNPSGIVVK